MNKIREKITSFQLITTSLINVLNIILFFICYEFLFAKDSLKYLTNITLYFNTIYLFLSCICDIYLVFNKSIKLEKINYFLRYKLCNIINPISYLVFILFWILVASGGIIDAFKSPMDTLYSIYSNFLINIFIFFDLFINAHDIHQFSWINLGFILLYIFCYLIIITICKINNIYTYEFLENIGVEGSIGYGILFITCSIGCYFIHILILKMKYKYIIKNKEKRDFNDEINKIIQMTDLSKASTEDEIE
jgi:hypothetical protein